MKRLLALLAAHKKLVLLLLASGGFLGVLPVMALGGHQLVESVDSPAFCTQTCHDVHYPEAVTFKASPHKEVSCSSCHIGPSPKNQAKAKLRGLTDIIPTITRSYERPISTPLKERRPSTETCEKCHWSAKFSGDMPRVKTTYSADERNTRDTSTVVLKVGGGEGEAASGIHWHSTATVWYLPLDDQRLQIAWAAAEDPATGKVTEYVDPERIAQITPERMEREKRRMDCVDCHNRVTHLFRSPDKLIDMALKDGSIDVGLPFIKREALKALDPQKENPKKASAAVDGIVDFYKVSYPEISRQKAASLNRAIVKLKEIARLTTFSDGLDWNTYADHVTHDKPTPEMEVDWDTVSSRDASPGCFRCHGNLVKLDSRTAAGDLAAVRGALKLDAAPVASAPDLASLRLAVAARNGISGLSSGPAGPGTEKLDAKCGTCHYSPKLPLDSPLAPATSHAIDGLNDCLVCHSPSSARPFKAEHPWATNGACNSCHKLAKELKPVPTGSPPPEANEITHSTNKLEDCLVCHGPAAGRPFSEKHVWSSSQTCTSCHKPAATLKPIPVSVPPKARDIPHSTYRLEDCLVCHGPKASRAVSAEHPWATNETCSTCHKPAQVLATFAPPPPGGAAGGGAGAGPAPPPAPPVIHSIAGLGACSICHNGAGAAPFPNTHAGRTDGMCLICHQAATPPAPAVPAAPTGLSATAASAAQVDLTWTDNAGNENGFRIERATNSAFSANLVTVVAAVNTTSYSDGMVSGSTTYYYRVSAYNATGNSVASNTASATTPAPTGTVPAAPSLVTATPAGATQIDLTWTDNSNNETGFRIERATNSSFTANLATATVGPNIVSYSVTGLTSGTIYYFRVTATGTGGNSAASNSPSATTPLAIDAAALYSTNCATCHGANRQGTAAGPAVTATALSSRTIAQTTAAIANGQGTMPGYSSSLTSAQISALADYLKNNTPTVPAAPTALAATAASSTQINLTWTDNASTETGFRIERATNSTFTANLVTATVGANVASYGATGLAGSSTYYFRVFATSAAGDSVASNTASATTPAPSGSVPSAPTALAATAVSGTQVDLTWTDNSNSETGFLAQRATNNTFTANLATATLGANTATYSASGLTGGTTYYFRVMATNASGNSAASNTASATTPAVVDAPALYSTNCASCHGANRQGTTAGPAVTGTALSSRTIAQVTAVITSGQGTMPGYSSSLSSAQVSALAQWLKGPPPAAPTNLATSAASAGQVNLTWVDNATDEAGFRVERATNSAFGAGLTSFTRAANTTSTSDTTVAGSTTYYYRVFASSSAGDSAASNTVSVTTPAATGTAPAAPSALSATAVSATQVDLSWADNANNETGFSLDRALNSTFTTGLVTVAIPAGSTAYSDTTLGAGITYYYRIAAVNSAGSSAESNTASATTPAALQPPSVAHTTTGYTDCLACHSSFMTLPTTHAGRTNTTCLTCHPLSGSTAAPTLSVGAPRLDHSLDSSHQNCLSCHDRGRDKPFPQDHTGRQNITCLVCHRTR